MKYRTEQYQHDTAFTHSNVNDTFMIDISSFSSKDVLKLSLKYSRSLNCEDGPWTKQIAKFL